MRSMVRCDVCGNTTFHDRQVEEVDVFAFA